MSAVNRILATEIYLSFGCVGGGGSKQNDGIKQEGGKK